MEQTVYNDVAGFFARGQGGKIAMPPLTIYGSYQKAGITLYYFSKNQFATSDGKNTANCTAQLSLMWPRQHLILLVL